MIGKTLTAILLGTNLIFNSCENYKKPQTKTIQETQIFPEGSPEGTAGSSFEESSLGEDTLLKAAGKYFHQGDYELAKKTYSNFLEIKTQKNDSLGIAKAFQGIGMVFAKQGNYNRSSEYYINSLKIYENLQDGLRSSNISRSLGLLFFNQNKFEKALEYFNKSLDIKKTLNDSSGISFVLNNLGMVFDEQKEYDKALKYYFNSLEIAEKINNKAQEADCYNNIAVVYRKEKNIEKAFEYYQKSLIINKELENKEGLATNFINISDIYLEKANYFLALENLKKADTISKEIENPSLQKDIYETFSQIYKAKKDYKSSLEYHVLFSQTKDTLLNEKSLKQVAELSTIYETEKKEQENNLLKKDNQIVEEKNEKQKWGLLGMGAFLGLAGIFSYSLYKSRKKIQKSKKIIEEKNKEITDSINYAKNIQNSILPREEEFNRLLPENFVLYMPKDIVSGDFYWLNEKPEKNKIYFSASDCTGHGVPGAFMSMLNSRLLSEAVNEKQIEKPNEILNYVRKNIIDSLKSTSKIGEQKDGMDSALCVLDKNSNTLEFACAHNPLFLIRNNELIEHKADRMPVGYSETLKDFSLNKINLQKNDLIYIFSDGYQDQIGGEKEKKFMKKNLKELLLSVREKPMLEQKEILNKKIEDWMSVGKQKQMDDILVIGIKI